MTAAGRPARITFFLLLLAVLVLALWPSPASLPLQTGWDKADHVLAFAVLGVFGLSAWPGRPVGVSAWLLVYGGSIEGLQALTKSRQADWHDVVADLVGILLGVIVVQCLRRYRIRRDPGVGA